MGSQCSCSVLLCIFFIVLMLVFVDGNRQLHKDVSSCPHTICAQNTSIIHVKAVATDNSSTIHYLWTTYPVPTIVVAYTSQRHTDVHINWANLTNVKSHHLGLRFDPPVNYTVAFAMPRIYEFEDNNDNVDLSDNSYMAVREFSESTKWEMDLDESNSSAEVKFTANDSIIFKFIASHSEDRESQLPYQKHTADSNQFSLTLDHTNVTTNKTRFAVEVNYICPEGQKLDVSVTKSIDDEYTPAVFETVYAKISGEHFKAYSQWKPIAYTNSELGRKYQTKARVGSVKKLVNRSWNIGEAAMNDTYVVYGVNVSFGLTKDGFYQKNKYLTWSGIVGYGNPASSSLSLLVILIISIGLGLPLAIIVFGGTFVQVRKRCWSSKLTTPYVKIN